MAVRQATLTELDRGGSETTQSARVVLSGQETGSVFDPAVAAFGNLICDYNSDYDRSLDDLDRAWDLARDIIDDGSPAERESPDPTLDRSVWCFGPSCIDDALTVADRSTVEVRQVMVPAVHTLGTTVREIADRLEPLADLDAKIAVCAGEDWVRVDSRQGFRAFLNGVRAAGGLGIQLQREASKADIRRWSGVDKEGGRAGLGFEWVEVGDEGETEWVPADDYERVVSVLEMVRDGELSKRQGAAELDTSPRTITRCIEERPGRYGLDK